MSGMFGGTRTAWSSSSGASTRGGRLCEIAQSKPDYLEWMQREDFFDDTKAIALEALGRPVARAS